LRTGTLCGDLHVHRENVHAEFIVAYGHIMWTFTCTPGERTRRIYCCVRAHHVEIYMYTGRTYTQNLLLRTGTSCGDLHVHREKVHAEFIGFLVVVPGRGFQAILTCAACAKSRHNMYRISAGVEGEQVQANDVEVGKVCKLSEVDAKSLEASCMCRVSKSMQQLDGLWGVWKESGSAEL
jgi:hypothetical protein